MCGLSFLLDRTGRLGAAAAARMQAATAHRGPDGSGRYQFGDGGPGTVYLGHNRLKITDLSDEAAQPMISEDGRYGLVFNGEIYNWRELRGELERRQLRFRTQSDTEVLLQLLIRDGAAAVAKLRGMFAFVFYDHAQQRALAGRDDAAIKPLFVLDTPDGLAISSEMGGVLSSGLGAGAWQSARLKHYLSSRFVAGPGTFWPAIGQVAPGAVVAYPTAAAATAYAPAGQNPAFLSPAAPAIGTVGSLDPARVRHLLKQSLARHLTADVPVGLWLSGGVDSTLLLALAQEMGRSVPCFSAAMGPQERSFGTDDRRFARAAAKQYAAEYHEFELSDDLLLDTDAALAALGQPIADSSVLLTWWLAQQTRREVKAVLSGAGADEWFAGYNRHQAFAWYLRGRWALPHLRPLLQPLSRWLPGATHSRWRKQLRLAQRFLDHTHPDPQRTLASFVGLDPALGQTLTSAAQWPAPGEDEGPETYARYVASLLPDTAPPPTALVQLLAYDRFGYLPNDILLLTDQTAMRHGLEVRTPYLDQDLTAYLRQIPAAELLRHGPKWVLRALLDARGGQAFTQRAKEGFGLPLGRWLRLPKHGWLLDPVRRADHPLFAHFDYARTQQLLERFRTSRHDLTAEVWALITLFRWYDLQPFAGRHA